MVLAPALILSPFGNVGMWGWNDTTIGDANGTRLKAGVLGVLSPFIPAKTKGHFPLGSKTKTELG